MQTQGRQQLENLVSQNVKRHREEQRLISSECMKRVAALWIRMGQLYRNKWESQEGPLTIAQDGQEPQFSTNAKLWARKTQYLRDEDFKRGFEELEFRVKQAGQKGDSVWPPTYAEFMGYCEKPMCTQMYSERTAARIPRYDEEGRVVGFIAPQEKANLLTTNAQKSAAKDTLSNLKNMFSDVDSSKGSLQLEPCLKCGKNFYAVLSVCEHCSEKRPKAD